MLHDEFSFMTVLLKIFVAATDSATAAPTTETTTPPPPTKRPGGFSEIQTL